MKDLKYKIALVCVNYNSYDSLHIYINSVSEAVSYNNNLSLNVDVFIADNSTHKEEINTQISDINVFVYCNDNIGYFKAAFHIIKNVIDYNKYDYICISNVDLVVDKSFFSVLFRKKYDKKIAWIAPSIFSYDENKDKNPATLYRRSLLKMMMLKLLFRFPVLYKVYKFTIYKTKDRKKSKSEILQIYAGHGSFIILTNNFFDFFSDFEYPLFLYGEELFLAEHIRLLDMRVCYDNSLLIYDYDHVSTKNINYKIIAKYNSEALKYIINRFYI